MLGSMLILLAVLYLPGVIIGMVSGLRIWWALAVAPALTFAVCGLAGAGLYWIGVPFNLLTSAIACLVLIAVAFGWRVLCVRSAKKNVADANDGMWQTAEGPAAPRWRQWITVAPAPIGVLLGAAANFIPVWRQRAGDVNQDTIPQLWDANWHGSVIRWIQETGIASPTQTGQLFNYESQAANFYPLAWHSFAALTGDISGNSPTTTMNLAAMVITAVTIPVGAAALAWMLVDRPGLIRALAAGFAAIFSSALPVLYSVSFGVGAWPYAVALSLVPMLLALLVTVPHHPRRLFAVAFGVVGAAQVHLAALPVLVLLAGIYWVFYRLWNPVRSRIADFTLMVVPGLLAMVILAPQLLVMIRSGQAEDSVGFDGTEEVTRSEAWRDVLLMLTRHASEDPPVWPVIILGLIGLTIILLWRRGVWAAVTMILLLFFTVNAMLPFGGLTGSLLAVYGELHYSMPHRLIMPVAFFYAAGAGVAVAALLWLLTGGAVRRWDPKNSVAAVIVAALVAAVVTPWAAQQPQESRIFAFGNTYDPWLIDEADVRAMDWLAAQPEAWEHNTYNNPNQGMAWLYPWTGLPSIFTHFQWPNVADESATNNIYWHADKIGAGASPEEQWELNTIDESVRDLDVGFILISPPNLWSEEEYFWSIHDGVWNAPGTTPVYLDGDVGIVAINGVIPDEAIERMRAESPEQLGTLPTRQEVGLADAGDPDANTPYIFHPGADEDDYPLVGRPGDQPEGPVTPKPQVLSGPPGQEVEVIRR